MPVKKNLTQYHLFIRITSRAGGGEFTSQNVIEAHNATAQEHGFVYFGKAGRELASEKIGLLRQCIHDGGCVQLVVGLRSDDGLEYFTATMLEIHGKGFVPNREQIPEYYRAKAEGITMWVCIKDFTRIDERKLRCLAVASTGVQLTVVAPACQTPMMLLTER